MVYLVIEKLGKTLGQHLKCTVESVSFVTNPIKTLMLVFRTSKILIFSNPLLLFLFFMNRKAIHFIQSIDENLFSSLDYNPYAVAVYKYLIKFLMKYGRNYQIYNSNYVANYYKT